MKRFLHRVLADIVFILHVVLFLIVMGGAIYSIYHPAYLPWHILVISLVALHNMTAKGCVLTWLEEHLRRKYNPHLTLDNAFLATYVHRFTGWRMRRRQAEWTLFVGRMLAVVLPVIVFLLN